MNLATWDDIPIQSQVQTNLTDANMAVNVNKVVMLIPIRASTIEAGTRKHNQVIMIKNELGMYV